LKKWIRFRKDFIGFIDRLDIERQLYRQMLQRLLLSAGVSHSQVELYMDSSFAGWQRENVQESVERRLGSVLPAFLSTVTVMNLLMDELQKLLSLKDGRVICITSARLQKLR
jgi:hypothetical protein